MRTGQRRGLVCAGREVRGEHGWQVGTPSGLRAGGGLPTSGALSNGQGKYTRDKGKNAGEGRREQRQSSFRYGAMRGFPEGMGRINGQTGEAVLVKTATGWGQ
jgi:hypothetical protein